MAEFREFQFLDGTPVQLNMDQIRRIDLTWDENNMFDVHFSNGDVLKVKNPELVTPPDN
mgnify:CR=1 FL=1